MPNEHPQEPDRQGPETIKQRYSDKKSVAGSISLYRFACTSTVDLQQLELVQAKLVQARVKDQQCHGAKEEEEKKETDRQKQRQKMTTVGEIEEQKMRLEC